MSDGRPLAAVVLAAGEGTRMRSATPKVLHPLCGRPMLLHVIDALRALPLERVVVVVGHRGDEVAEALADLGPDGGAPVVTVEQRERRGTGDAVAASNDSVSEYPSMICAPLTASKRFLVSAMSGAAPLTHTRRQVKSTFPAFTSGRLSRVL